MCRAPVGEGANRTLGRWSFTGGSARMFPQGAWMPGVRKVPGRFGGEPTRSIDAATWCLIALVIAGVALSRVTEVGWWPAATTLADSSAYARFAESNPFADPQHPA